MIKRLLISILILLSAICSFAQQIETVVFTINGIPVYKSEVERAYKKRTVESNETINEFLEGYIDFKLNVAEAKAQRLDTTARYQRQLSTYRSQIATPYLKDVEYENEYIAKIYNRMLENVEINHVMFPFEKEEIVLPADTLVAYKKAMEGRKRILEKGFANAGFNTERSGSRFLPRAEARNGYMGWVSPFMLASDVEDAIYSLPLMEVSMPIRAARGYHIIQVLNKRPAMGSAEIEQVVFNFTQIPPMLNQIDSVGKVAWREYKDIKSEKGSFDALCDEFIRVHQTDKQNCYFGVVGLDSNLPLDFTMAALNLKIPGEISEPVMSDYGFHIIRLIKRMPIPTFEEIKPQLRERIIRSDKVQNLSNERRNRLQKTFNVRINDEAYAKLAKIANKISPRDSAFLSEIKNQDEMLIDIEGQRGYPVREFEKYIRNRQISNEKKFDEPMLAQTEEASPYSLSTDILKEYLDGFTSLLLMSYEDDTLGDRSPEFAQTMNSISEDLLFFEGKDKNVWKRSTKDEKGLAEYFSQNKTKYSLGDIKYKGIVVYAQDKESLRKAKSIADKNQDQETIIEKIKSTLNRDSITVKIEAGLWSQGENPYIDNKIFNGKEPAPYKGYPYFFVIGKLINKPEDYTDVRNKVEQDYQDQLEKDWSTYLKNKYKVEINQSVLNSIK